MKTLKYALLFVFLMQGTLLTAQTEVEKSDEKATVYIVRTSAVGALINYKYFIDDTYLGKCNYGKHLKLVLHDGKQTWSSIAFKQGYWFDKLQMGQNICLQPVVHSETLF